VANRDPRRVAELSLLGLAGLCFLALTRYHLRHVCDDAFISFRYAENVVAGAGPVWNHGERVEGYSSPLWLGILVVGRILGAPLPAWATAWGVASALACLVLAHRLTFAIVGSRLAAAAAVMGCALLYPLHFWAPAGLETTLFTALLTAAAWSLLARSEWLWPVVAALLGCARPEGPLLTGVLTILAALARGRQALRPARLCLALVPVVLLFFSRRWYYGEWLPNTYFAKATGDLLARLTAGTIYATWGLAALVATVAAVGWGGIANHKHIAVLALAVTSLAITIGAGGDWMWHGRMVLPVLPACVALACGALACAPGQRRLALAAGCVVGFSGFLPRPEVVAGALSGGRLPPAAYQEGKLVAANLEAAHYIAEHYPAEALVAVNHAGALPYALPNPALDMAGLCDRHVAHEVAGGLHRKFDAAYVLSRRPHVVVLNSRTRPGTAGLWYHPGYWAGETALVATPDFAAHYHPVPRFWEWQWQAAMGGGFVLLYERLPD
jgi:arabinofuranosyltransferase